MDVIRIGFEIRVKSTAGVTEKGKGTGLGLATVYGVVKQSGGYIWVSSEVGKGTTFRILLPPVADTVSAVSPRAQSANAKMTLSTMLLVEDEDSLREMISDLLKRNGYRVLVASTGAQAIEAEQGFAGPIHLLLTDVVLPGMSGPTLAKHLTTTRPEMRVLFMSGYAEFKSEGRGNLPPDALLLQKPFTRDVLLRQVAEALAASRVEIPV